MCFCLWFSAHVGRCVVFVCVTKCCVRIYGGLYVVRTGEDRGGGLARTERRRITSAYRVSGRWVALDGSWERLLSAVLQDRWLKNISSSCCSRGCPVFVTTRRSPRLCYVSGFDKARKSSVDCLFFNKQGQPRTCEFFFVLIRGEVASFLCVFDLAAQGTNILCFFVFAAEPRTCAVCLSQLCKHWRWCVVFLIIHTHGQRVMCVCVFE